MKYYQELQEGLYDPNIFKAFFLTGGPGSGKSYVVRRTTGGTGLKIVNSDPAFESLLKKAGLSLKMPPEEFERKEKVRAHAHFPLDKNTIWYCYYGAPRPRDSKNPLISRAY